MAVAAPARQVAPARRGGPIRSTVTLDAWDEAQIETQSLREELRALGKLSSHAAAIHRYIASVGESTEAEQLAAAVAVYLARTSRRHP